MAELIQADWAAVGVKTEIVTAEWADYLKRTGAGEHDAYLLGGSTDNGDPDNLMSYMLSCDGVKGGSNRSRWCSPDFEKLLNAGRVEQDLKARAKIYQSAQGILDAEAPLLPIANSVVSMPIRKRVLNYTLDAFGRQNFADVDVVE
jgi:dipeptide transport system substrate-binding protein